MSYDFLRHLADSWGLLFMSILFLILVGWTFRKGASKHHHDAAHMIFKDDEHGG
ncbi:cytochrome C oxidase Cbb3 [Sphingorhabdus lutea]|uniref:Cytochrome C oxidase Cbb3 n=1 Tax=Sphingorhabdus lutea TaxID=1913578 RepID=A0A1L3J9V6_9SPHN|nr:cbb3-type cytochrome c oxidase subunit 3 [Sphingorhabdus lutea]APG61917.1 cytochrome C oxidase Cbb3 [Sphingorhabdus lutea]